MALRVAGLWAGHFVVRRSKIHQGYSPVNAVRKNSRLVTPPKSLATRSRAIDEMASIGLALLVRGNKLMAL